MKKGTPHFKSYDLIITWKDEDMKMQMSRETQKSVLLSNNVVQMKQSTLFFNKKFQLEDILERLQKRDNEIFGRIVEAIKTKDSFLTRLLASELAKIRILERSLIAVSKLP